MKLYRYFLDGHPIYLVQHYWWAYLWRPAVWFFDHQFIINAILFGQYKKLMTETLGQLKNITKGEILQLTCVYGSLTKNILLKIFPQALHIADVSQLQLKNVRHITSDNQQLLPARMNVERLAYKNDAFSTIVIFFLLHEMPLEARRRVLKECMRVISSGGILQYTEYAPLPSKHMLYRFYPFRLILTYLEPFLSSYWDEDILSILNDSGKPYGKEVEVVSHKSIFLNFYRVTQFRVLDI